MYRETLV